MLVVGAIALRVPWLERLWRLAAEVLRPERLVLQLCPVGDLCARKEAAPCDTPVVGENQVIPSIEGLLASSQRAGFGVEAGSRLQATVWQETILRVPGAQARRERA